MIIVLPTTSGVLVGIDPGLLMKRPKGKKVTVSKDDLRRFQAVQHYLNQHLDHLNNRDREN